MIKFIFSKQDFDSADEKKSEKVNLGSNFEPDFQFNAFQSQLVLAPNPQKDHPVSESEIRQLIRFYILLLMLVCSPTFLVDWIRPVLTTTTQEEPIDIVGHIFDRILSELQSM